MNVIECTKKIFDEPNMTNSRAESIIWGCTGFPCFWKGDPIRCFVKQLRHAKRSMEKGFTIGQIYMGEDKCHHPTLTPPPAPIATKT